MQSKYEGTFLQSPFTTGHWHAEKYTRRVPHFSGEEAKKRSSEKKSATALGILSYNTWKASWKRKRKRKRVKTLRRAPPERVLGAGDWIKKGKKVFGSLQFISAIFCPNFLPSMHMRRKKEREKSIRKTELFIIYFFSSLFYESRIKWIDHHPSSSKPDRKNLCRDPALFEALISDPNSKKTEEREIFFLLSRAMKARRKKNHWLKKESPLSGSSKLKTFAIVSMTADDGPLFSAGRNWFIWIKAWMNPGVLCGERKNPS